MQVSLTLEAVQLIVEALWAYPPYDDERRALNDLEMEYDWPAYQKNQNPKVLAAFEADAKKITEEMAQKTAKSQALAKRLQRLLDKQASAQQ